MYLYEFPENCTQKGGNGRSSRFCGFRLLYILKLTAGGLANPTTKVEERERGYDQLVIASFQWKPSLYIYIVVNSTDDGIDS